MATTNASTLGRALEEALGPAFVSKQMSTEVVYGAVDPTVLEQTLSWADLNDLLNRGSVEPAELKLCTGGQPLPENDFHTRHDGHRVLDHSRMFSLMREGASLIIDSLDRVHPAIRRATDDVQRLVGETASCNLFVTFGDSQALTSHYDEVDTLIVQVLGTKKWQVHGPSELHPLPEYGDSDPALCPEEVVFRRTLTPGDVLHVPRGWWHTVRGGGDTSLHLTFAFTRPTGYDWLRWVVWRSLANEHVRESLLRVGPAEARQAQAERLVQAFLDEARSTTLDDYFAAERRHAGGRAQASLPWNVVGGLPPEESIVDWTTMLPPVMSAEGGHLELVAFDRKHSLPAEYHKACSVLASHRRISIAELAARAEMPVTAASSLVAALLRTGLVAVSDPLPRDGA